MARHTKHRRSPEKRDMSFYRLLGHWASRCRYSHRHESHPSSRSGTCTRLEHLRHPRAPQGCWKSSESQSGFTFNAQLRSLRNLRVRKKTAGVQSASIAVSRRFKYTYCTMVRRCFWLLKVTVHADDCLIRYWLLASQCSTHSQM